MQEVNRPRRLRAALGAAAVLAALAVPATASASQDHVVTLKASSDCAQLIRDVTADYGITPTMVYQSALCGFAAPLSKRTERALVEDPRVDYITGDDTVAGR